MTGEQIIEAIMAYRKIGPKDFFSSNRASHLVKARRAAILALKAQGFSLVEIAKLMQRSYSIVRYWANPKRRVQHKVYALKYWAARRAIQRGEVRA